MKATMTMAEFKKTIKPEQKRIDHEGKEQAALFRLVEKLEVIYPELKWMHHIPNGGKRPKSTGNSMKKQGLKSGVWDIFLPVAKCHFHGLYIEMKHGKNTLSEAQAQFGFFAEEQGYMCRVCYSKEQAIDIITDYMGGVYEPK